MTYQYQFHDGDEWVTVKNESFTSAAEAKAAGVEAGFEYVRVVRVEP